MALEAQHNSLAAQHTLTRPLLSTTAVDQTIAPPIHNHSPTVLHQEVHTMAPESNAFHGSYTSLAKDCRHIIHYSTPSALEVKLSRPADTYSEPPDWKDEYAPQDFVCISANTLLCRTCEQAMRHERQDAAEAYANIYDGERYADGTTEEIVKAATRRHRLATAAAANFADRMYDRRNTIAQAQAVAAREQKWEAGRKVRFAVAEGMGSGERRKRPKLKRNAIVLGPPPSRPSDSAISLPVRAKEEQS